MNWMLNVWSPFCCHLGECMSLRSSARDSADFAGSRLDIWLGMGLPLLRNSKVLGPLDPGHRSSFSILHLHCSSSSPQTSSIYHPFRPTSTIQVLWSHFFGSLEHVPLGHLRWLWMSSFGKLHSTSAIGKRCCTPNLQEKSLREIGTVGRFSILNHEEVGCTWMHRVYRVDTCLYRNCHDVESVRKTLFIASYVTFFGVKNKVREVYEAPLKRKLPSLLLVTSVTSCRTMFVLINHVGICLILNIGLRRNLYREFPASEFSGRVGLMLFWEDVPFESIWLMRFQVGWSHRLPLPPCHEHFFGWPLGDEHDLLQDPVHVETGWCARMGCENHGT